MTVLHTVLSTYAETHRVLARRRDELETDLIRALDDGDSALTDSLHEALGTASAMVWINTEAHFLLVFAQFESLVTELAATAIETGRRHPDAAARRAWQVLYDRARQSVQALPFLDRMALLLDKGDSAYQAIRDIYQKRNHVAHGSPLSEMIDVMELAEQLQAIAARLQEPR
ncbi:hypothetical protein [Rhodocista pekingensis]|uniref:RiboL-PSP-HEPN domain-containing protein n=1 Tax=Rhodocista pekingensis TaxID=201185 RepID=A0ABW2KRA0_9PROT